ncbi:MAG TPA: hypothetical protein PKD09_05290 [Aggregatilinea sp.]|uniref:hypothetical protein n=1 Tax=Aggregatilinea sp. TaxID=2806333 RepID=UPI002C7B32E2|nr:hypothetical protein [Aggregatilinea sp.]HML21040.1 hypothetical protein [Aggregatilinea sp.]
MGILSNPKDGATYLSKIEQGRRGAWLFELRHTPEAHDGAGFHTFYIFLGHIALLTGLSDVIIFHLARVATSLFMFIALYQLGATIWVRLRPRRLFFTLIAVGSGLGWLLLLFGSGEIAADMNIPEAFPLFAAYTNPHFPLSIAALALIASTYITVFRRGYQAEPSVDNGGLTVMLLSMLLALIQPTALVPIGGALVIYVLIRYRLTREFPVHELRWSSMLWLPAVPFAIYDVAVFRFNDIMGEFNQQNQTPSPAPYLYLFGYGLLLLVAVPGLIRAVRRFERDGDQFMLLWFVINVAGLYVPFNLQRRLALGLIIPLVYFAVRALEDYWFYKIPRDWRAPAMIALVVFLVPSNILNLGVPLFGAVVDKESGLSGGILMETDYWNTLQWLDQEGTPNTVVLAEPTFSLWVPAYTDQRVVYGHEFETVPNEERLAQVEDWYLGRDCTTLLGDDLPFQVRYIVWGPRERTFIDENGPTSGPIGKCIDAIPEDRIQQKVEQGEVTIYDLGPA